MERNMDHELVAVFLPGAQGIVYLIPYFSQYMSYSLSPLKGF